MQKNYLSKETKFYLLISIKWKLWKYCQKMKWIIFYTIYPSTLL